MKIFFRYCLLTIFLLGILNLAQAQQLTQSQLQQIKKSNNSLQNVIGKTCVLNINIQNKVKRLLVFTNANSTTTASATTTITPVAVLTPIQLKIVRINGIPQATPQNSNQPPAFAPLLPFTIQPDSQIKLLTIPINSLNTPPVNLSFQYALIHSSNTVIVKTNTGLRNINTLVNMRNINYPVTLLTQPGNPCVVTAVQQPPHAGARITVNPNNILVFN